jgi:hypothetical protein
MDNDLLSKKELLELTGISYGQLYRWKRKGLIPEDWFIRRSTYTGQETFFPREKILERVDHIKNMKDDISLDDLAGVFSPEVGDIRLSAEQISSSGIAGAEVVAIYAELYGGKDYAFDDMVFMALLGELLNTGGVNRDEAACALRMIKDAIGSFKDGFCELFAVRKLGVFACFIVSSPCEIRFEQALKVIAQIKIPELKEKLKLKLL